MAQNEYLIQKSTLDEIAIQSNNLVGKTESVSPATMISDLTDANTEVGSQTELINQIASVLQGKAIEGGGREIETCTGTINFSGLALEEYPFYYVDKNLSLQIVDMASTLTTEVMKNSIVFTDCGMRISGNATALSDDNDCRAAYVFGDFSIETNN